MVTLYTFQLPANTIEGLVNFRRAASAAGLHGACSKLAQHQLLKTEFGDQALELGVFLLQLFQAPGLIRAQASIFLMPS